MLRCITSVLIASACAPTVVPREAAKPQIPRPPTTTDSAPPAARDSGVIVFSSRPKCPMPVLRGDASHDTLMVVKLRPSPHPAAGPAALCDNPLFR
jgi:hypothetical protein